MFELCSSSIRHRLEYCNFDDAVRLYGDAGGFQIDNNKGTRKFERLIHAFKLMNMDIIEQH